MQHIGWLETLIYAKFPSLDLVFRNLAAQAMKSPPGIARKISVPATNG